MSSPTNYGTPFGLPKLKSPKSLNSYSMLNMWTTATEYHIANKMPSPNMPTMFPIDERQLAPLD